MERHLPDELWIQIFEYALDEDLLLMPTLPTSMSEHAWYIRYIHSDPKTVEKDWALRSPQEALAVIQRENWATKRALWNSCRRFNNLVSPYLYRCLSFDDPSQIPRFNSSLNLTAGEKNGDGLLARNAKRIFVAHGKVQDDHLVQALSTLISHTPNLQSLMIDSASTFSLFPVQSAFTSLAGVLTSTPIRKTLHTLHLHAVPYESLSALILTIDSLRRNLVVAHIHVSAPKGEEDIRLGSAGGMNIELEQLRQLSLAGRFGALMDQMICGGWGLSELRALSVDVGGGRVEMPDVVGFLCGTPSTSVGGESIGGANAGANAWAGVGPNLWFLDIQATVLQPELDVPKILDTCHQLRIFGFNADWRFPVAGNQPPGLGQNQQEQAQARIVLPGAHHHHIHTILLHGLNYAFNPGPKTQTVGVGFQAHFVRRSNDMNFSALTKENFPSLKRIRIASPRVLQELEENGGPTSASSASATSNSDANPTDDGGGGWATVFSQATAVLSHASSANPYGAGGGMLRWERWYDQCAALGIRLEDCTGGVLGELPPPLEDDEDDSEDGEEEGWESDGNSGEEHWEEEEEVADALLSPSDSESDSPKSDSKGKGKETPPKRRNRPRLSAEEALPYISKVKEMTRTITPPPTPPDSPKKPSNSHFKFSNQTGLSRPHVHELRKLVEECRVFEEQGEREKRMFMGSQQMSALMGEDDEFY